MGHNSAVIDATQDLIHFPHLKMQDKNAASEANSTPQPVFNQDSITVPPLTTKTITTFVDHPSDWHTQVL